MTWKHGVITDIMISYEPIILSFGKDTHRRFCCCWLIVYDMMDRWGPQPLQLFVGSTALQLERLALAAYAIAGQP